ncbi:MAG: hypothetical protein SGPRY_011860, partial [Prymnesium sp.]
VRALSRVRHPNVVVLYGVYNKRTPRVVMALAKRSLRDDIESNNSRPPAPDIARLLAAIASGMSAVHLHSLTHLDLKPENVLLSEHGEPYALPTRLRSSFSATPSYYVWRRWITDFGLATSNLSQAVSEHAANRGTLAYKAPELFPFTEQGVANVSPAADMYSFGVLAYEVITRSRAWGQLQSPVTEIPSKVERSERPSLQDEDWSTLVPELTPWLRTWWEQDHTMRPMFADVAELLDHLAMQLTKRSNNVAANEEAVEMIKQRLLHKEEELKKMSAQQRKYEELDLARCEKTPELEELQEDLNGLTLSKGAAEHAKKSLEDLLLANGNPEQLTSMLENIMIRQERHDQMLGEHMRGSLKCPRIPWLQPQPPAKSMLQRVARLAPKHWFANSFRLYFICPITLRLANTNDGKGYSVQMPKDWVVKYGPAFRVALQVMDVAVAASHVMGLPLPKLSTAKEHILSEEAIALRALRNVLANEDVARPYDKIPDAKPLEDAGFRALLALVKEQCGDPEVCAL